MQFLKENRNVFLFLGGLVLLVYFNALGNGFVSDDIASIQYNPLINRLEYFLRFPYFIISPILFFHYVINHIFGLNPFFFRMINISGHTGVTFLIYIILRRLSNSVVAVFAATVFAVHPILIESVAWISGSPYSLGTFFVLITFFLFLGNKNKFAIFFYYLALCSSEKTIILPLILFIYELALGNLKTKWQKLIPFFLLSFFWGVFLFSQIGTRISTLETTFGGVQAKLNPLVQIPIAVTSYLQLIFWPDGLTLYHSEMFFSQTEYLIRTGLFVLFLAGITISFFKNRSVFFWLSFFLISLIPTLTPLGVSWIVAERYVYLGTIGIIVTVAIILQKYKNAFWYILAIIAFLLALRTISRNADWQSHDTLWLATARVSPSSSQNHNNLGDYYGRHGDLKRSAGEFEIAIKLNPQYADAYHNLGNANRDMGNLDLAIENYKKALTFNPGLWQSYLNIGAIYYYQKNIPLAKEYFSKAVQLNPEIKPLTDKL